MEGIDACQAEHHATSSLFLPFPLFLAPLLFASTPYLAPVFYNQQQQRRQCDANRRENKTEWVTGESGVPLKNRKNGNDQPRVMEELGTFEETRLTRRRGLTAHFHLFLSPAGTRYCGNFLFRVWENCICIKWRVTKILLYKAWARVLFLTSS